MMNSTEIHPQTSPFFVLEPGHINVMPDDREHDVIKTKIYFPPQTKPPSLPKDDLKSKSCT